MREARNREVWAGRWLGTVAPDCFRFWLEDGLLEVETIGPLYPHRIRYSRDLVIAEAMSPAGGKDRVVAPRVASREPEAKSAPFPLLGRVESPHSNPGLVQEPTLPVVGWAISPAGIAGVEALIDGQSRVFLEYGQSRPDVVARYPEFERVNRARYGLGPSGKL